MRNVLVALFLVVGFVGSCAQNVSQKNVPSVILNAFMTSYPQATDVEWELKGSVYRVEFEIGKIDHEAWYDLSGKRLKHKEDVPLHALPAPVLNVIKQEFPDYRLDDVEKVDEGGNVFYVIELDGSPNDRILHVSPEGKVLDNRIDY